HQHVSRHAAKYGPPRLGRGTRMGESQQQLVRPAPGRAADAENAVRAEVHVLRYEDHAEAKGGGNMLKKVWVVGTSLIVLLAVFAFVTGDAWAQGNTPVSLDKVTLSGDAAKR